MDLVEGLGASLAYGAVGLAVLAAGVAGLDLVTTGKLPALVWRDQRRSAAVLVGANLLAVALVVVVAIMTSTGSLANGLLETAAYGLVGVVMQMIAFVVLDALTPGRLRDVVTEAAVVPSVWATAAAQIALGAVLAAAIS